MESCKEMLPSLMLALPFMLALEFNLSQLDQLLLNLGKMKNMRSIKNYVPNENTLETITFMSS